ncbi:rhamnosyltransferase WsaF family glycosyltransferase [Agrococcus carbonis]|uniref:Uncharacterized protein n=1 Tax=Agrococcus carbonis TaxID=684552 RepID=A0A1H1LCA5_9MICO|nr:glycosyl transferase group 1 [Agrococcus carbonis]SDR72194.1 hypothetical protein SAMN04489719_0529 [Agrococcus carbonis]
MKVRRALAVGPAGIAQRLAMRAYEATDAAAMSFNLDYDDILLDVPARLPEPTEPLARGRAARIGWVMTPPGAGSGGHTTVFRMVEALRARGHRLTAFVYDKYGVDVDELGDRIRRHWPAAGVDVRDARAGIDDVDAVVATSFETAHVIVRYARQPMRRLYFIQDFEPYFYGHGASYELAAMTYRLPFRRIALGAMLDGMIREATGIESDVVPFGCDSAAYRPPSPPVPRSGVVFYCRPGAPRRGYELAVAALRQFHRMHPDQEIHVYGLRPRGIGIPVTFHGRMSVPELNDLYGRTISGLAMSFTNITLVAEEMLAAGNIPVVNELALAHLVLPNPHVRWAAPTAAALAGALSDAVSVPDVAGRAARAAASIVERSWEPTKDAVVRLIEQEVYGS